jgi:predicted nucleic acid-binding protein
LAKFGAASSSCRGDPVANACGSGSRSILTDRFQGRILDIDRRVAEIWGMIMARGAAASARLPTIDALVAATAERYGMVIATRNLRDFASAAVAVVSPWVAGNGVSS